jgi:hypothetical protein
MSCLAEVSAETDAARAGILFGIAPGGACRATPVARGAVGSYPTVSSLPVPWSLRANPWGDRRFHFCGALRQVALPGRYPAPLSCGVRTFLARVAPHAAIRPSAQAVGYALDGDASRGVGKREAGSRARAAPCCAVGAGGLGPGASPIGSARSRQWQTVRV